MQSIFATIQTGAPVFTIIAGVLLVLLALGGGMGLGITGNVQGLRERRGTLAKEIRALSDKMTAPDYKVSAEDTANWERVNKDYDACAASLAIAERAAQVTQESETGNDPLVGRGNVNGDESREGRTTQTQREREEEARGNRPTEEDRALALQAWFRHQAGEEISDAQRAACKRTGMNPTRRTLDLGIPQTRYVREMQRAHRTHPTHREARMAEFFERAEQRDLSGLSPAAGAYTIPTTFINQLEQNMLAFGGVLQVAEILRTQGGEDMTWPTADDTSNTGTILPENTTIGSSVDPSFGAITWKAYKYSSKLIKVPVELMEDSAFDLVALIGQMLGERLGRITNTHMTTGTGAAQPRGIVTASSLGKTTASGTAITADEILDLVHSVDPAYRIGAGFMFHDGILLALRKLKDGEGRYLWHSGMDSGAPDSLWSYPITINQDMQATVASGTKTMLFGQLSKYKVRQVRGIRLRRLVERYADTDQEGFVAFIRQDGNLLNAGTAPVKHMLQA